MSFMASDGFMMHSLWCYHCRTPSADPTPRIAVSLMSSVDYETETCRWHSRCYGDGMSVSLLLHGCCCCWFRNTAYILHPAVKRGLRSTETERGQSTPLPPIPSPSPSLSVSLSYEKWCSVLSSEVPPGCTGGTWQSVVLGRQHLNSRYKVENQIKGNYSTTNQDRIVMRSSKPVSLCLFLRDLCLHSTV